ncbi:alpha/beta-hydrolase [Lentinus tigrinus ALCF2SS1-7]|uniref:alpha/beta-hydrolase n=1 Tax=Lentinus tigrinus ALCF2SS1-7 TaxID=1328758 RepID=UPI0011661891|nr:alpha/beta-hydrolase [Lentinus tigrinus ALCF2SS1-7]
MKPLHALFYAATLLFESALGLGAGTAAQPDTTVQWRACDPSLGLDPMLQCGFFKVPLDYHNRFIGNAQLALVKANATQRRRGTVFMNPGGPGVSGVTDLNGTSALLLDQTGGYYDIVSWDPRGVGSLTVPGDVFCFDSLEDIQAFFNGTIELQGIEMTGNFTDAADIQALLAQAGTMQQKYEGLAQRCSQHSDGKYLQYIGTAATARDLAALADALDGPGSPVNYIGLSYGTILGSWFINMFPERVGHVVLDGVVDPVKFGTEDIALSGWGMQLSDADRVYEALFTGCALAGPEGCSIASASQTPLDVNEDIQALLQAAHDAARENASVPTTSGQVRSLLREVMYSPNSWGLFANTVWPQLVQEVQAETGGNMTRRSTLRKPAENLGVPYSAEAIICGDSKDPTGANMTDVFNGIIATSNNISAMFGAAWPFATYYCPFWPIRAVERYEGPFNKSIAHPILVIGNTFDPATPFSGAKAVADELGNHATLVRLNGFGHTSQAEPSACISDIIRAYMVNGTLPQGDETVCEVDEDFEVFAGVNTSDIFRNMPAIDI